MHSKLKCLSRAALFAQLPEATRETLVTVSEHQAFYPKGSFIRQPDDGVNEMFILDKGRAKVYSIAENGHEKILHLLTDGDIEGQQRLFRPQASHNFIEATEDSWVCSIQYEDFQGLLQKTPELALTMLNNFGEQLIENERTTTRRDLLDAKERLYAYLQDFAEAAHSSNFLLPLKKQELASLMGISPETLSRQFKALTAEERIEVKGRQIMMK